MQDGVPENFTAGMLAPYLDGRGNPTGNTGMSYVDPDLLARAVTRLDAEGFQVHFHAIGDRAVREVLDSVRAARHANGHSDNRHHVAHIQVIHPDDLPRFKELEVAANIQALWAAHEPQMDDLTIPFLGAKRAELQYPFADLAALGVGLAAGSDWPVSSPNPLSAAHVAVNRRHADTPAASSFIPRQRLDVATFLRAYTYGSAWINHAEDETGSIEPDKIADLVILDRDPLAINPAELADISVLATYLGASWSTLRPASTADRPGWLRGEAPMFERFTDRTRTVVVLDFAGLVIGMRSVRNSSADRLERSRCQRCPFELSVSYRDTT
jgi:predicted amidohydrolase YtcJ